MRCVRGSPFSMDLHSAVTVAHPIASSCPRATIAWKAVGVERALIEVAVAVDVVPDDGAPRLRLELELELRKARAAASVAR